MTFKIWSEKKSNVKSNVEKTCHDDDEVDQKNVEYHDLQSKNDVSFHIR